MTPIIQFLSKTPIRPYGTTQMRCTQPADYLRASGYTVSTGCVYRNLPQATELIVFHRVISDPMTDRAIRLAKAMGAHVAYDVDDLIFDSGALNHFSAFGPHTPTEQVERYVRAIQQCDTVFCSTQFLKERLATLHSDVRVIRNGLSEQIRTKAITSSESGSNHGRVRLGYFSGSAHHDADFALIQEVLLELLEEQPNLELLLVGKLKFDERFWAYGDRFLCKSFMPYSEFIDCFSAVDINLVPLQTSNPFSHARSELKYIEAGIFGIPTVASPAASYLQSINHGDNGLLAGDSDWKDVLRSLIDDRDLRAKLGRIAQRDVQTNYTPSAMQTAWCSLLDGLNLQPSSVTYQRYFDLSLARQVFDLSRRKLARFAKR